MTETYFTASVIFCPSSHHTFSICLIFHLTGNKTIKRDPPVVQSNIHDPVELSQSDTGDSQKDREKCLLPL